jgi:chorismate synthase
MSINSFGHLLRFTSWGESHGAAIGGVVDGCPPGLSLSEADIQPWLDKRRPGQSRFTTQRKEMDQVRILSGIYEGKTTGAPISFIIDNADQRPKDYRNIEAAYRPGHADYSYDAKYGLRDPRGGGRSSARETACRVAAGAIARAIIPEVRIQACLIQLGGDPIDRANFDAGIIQANGLNCPDPAAAERWERLLLEARKSGDSLGAIAEVRAGGIRAGWGSPLYAKLDAELAAAFMGINAVKGVEIGEGFGAAQLKGSENADAIMLGEAGAIHFASNRSGGILGGISNGDEIVARIAFKPTPSIAKLLPTIDREGNETKISVRGRHDPCVAIRGVPAIEAMMALVLADHKLLHRAQCGERA